MFISVSEIVLVILEKRVKMTETLSTNVMYKKTVPVQGTVFI